MEKVAQLSGQELSELFRAAAAQKGVIEALVEKDFWVCYVLKNLFEHPHLKEILLFKGGTALSKVFNLINRFSEDIDLILDWRELGISDDEAWDPGRSATQQDKFNARLDDLGKAYIADKIVPVLTTVIADKAGGRLSISVSQDDGHTVIVNYPRAYHSDYLLGFIKLEIGPRAARVPNTRARIMPYAAREYPRVFEEPSCTVKAIVSERTFWEKVTILHQVAFMNDAKLLAPRYSRHYYDLYMMAGTETETPATKDVALLADVAAFKARFYRSPRARYDLAKPGTLRLVPGAKRKESLAQDYERMKEMIFGPVPQFDHIMAALTVLQEKINGSATEPTSPR